jgi:hypothetical protein
MFLFIKNQPGLKMFTRSGIYSNNVINRSQIVITQKLILSEIVWDCG